MDKQKTFTANVKCQLGGSYNNAFVTVRRVVANTAIILDSESDRSPYVKTTEPGAMS